MQSTGEHATAPILAALSSISLNAGIVMIVVGTLRVPRDEAKSSATPHVVVGPREAALRWVF